MRMTGSSSDGWIYQHVIQGHPFDRIIRRDEWHKDFIITHILAPWLQVLLITFKYSAIADLHNLQFTVAYALGFSVSTSRLLTTDLNTETITSNH
jgi:hypothetical protein